MRNRFLGNAGAVLALVVALATPSAAAPPEGRPPVQLPAVANVPVRQTPEIDPGVAHSAVTLLVGGLLILNDRRRRRSV